MSNSPVPVSVAALIRYPSRSCSSLAYFSPVREAIESGCRRLPRSEAAGLGWLPAIPIQITAGVDTGYDDNVTASTPSGEGSLFAAENIVLTYDRPGERTAILFAWCRTVYPVFRCDRPERKDAETSLCRLRITSRHGFPSTPAFTALTRTSPISNPMLARRTCVARYFDTMDIFALTYHWSSRLSLVTSYTFERVKYFSSSNGNSQNGVQNTSCSEPYSEHV